MDVKSTQNNTLAEFDQNKFDFVVERRSIFSLNQPKDIKIIEYLLQKFEEADQKYLDLLHMSFQHFE